MTLIHRQATLQKAKIPTRSPTYNKYQIRSLNLEHNAVGKELILNRYKQFALNKAASTFKNASKAAKNPSMGLTQAIPCGPTPKSKARPFPFVRAKGDSSMKSARVAIVGGSTIRRIRCPSRRMGEGSSYGAPGCDGRA